MTETPSEHRYKIASYSWTITEWIEPSLQFPTQYGTISGFAWLKYERARMVRMGKPVSVYQCDTTGEVCLLRGAGDFQGLTITNDQLN